VPSPRRIPLRLRARVLTAPRQLRSGLHVAGYQVPVLPERRLLRDDAAGVEDFLTRWSAPGWPTPEESEAYRRAALLPGVAHSALEYFRWSVRSLPRPDGLRYAQAMREPVRIPVLQLHGALDKLVLPATAADSVRHVEAPYRWRLLDGAGHFPHEEVADVFTGELLGWLRDPEPDRDGRAAARSDRDRRPAGRAGPRNARARDALAGRCREATAADGAVDPIPDDLCCPRPDAREAQRLLDGGRRSPLTRCSSRWKSAPGSERDLWQGLARSPSA
jgi:hypothetical protein